MRARPVGSRMKMGVDRVVPHAIFMVIPKEIKAAAVDDPSLWPNGLYPRIIGKYK